MAGYVIEQVEDLDAAWPDVVTLVTAIIDYHRPWNSLALREDWEPRMQKYMADGVTFLARDASGQPAGFVSGHVKRDFGIFVELEAHIDNAFVLEAHRRDGLGSELVERFDAWCRAQGATEITLDVIQGNDLGLGFWQKSGFAPRVQTMGKFLEASS